MNGLDLDTLRARWADSSHSLDATLMLDREAVSRALAGRTAAAFRRHSLWLLPGLVMTACALLGLIWFIARRWQDPLYLSIAVVLALFAIAELAVGARQWRTLGHLDFTRPALDVQTTLDDLRARRLRLTQWIMLTSVLLWLPAIALLLNAFTGIDLLRRLDSSVVQINVLVGVLFIPIALAVGRISLRRWVGGTGIERFKNEAAGGSWSRAHRLWQRQQRTVDGPEHALSSSALAASLAGPLRVIHRRLIAGILLHATLILAIGMFNATHGGEWQFIAPGIALNLLFVSQMVERILHRLQLKRMHDEVTNPTDLALHLNEVAVMREKAARFTLLALPLLALAFAQVVNKLAADFDLLSTLGAWPSLLLVAIALGAGFQIYRSAKRDGAGIASRIAGALAGRSTRLTRALIPAADAASAAPEA